jgi:hypothetical protein
MNTNQTNTNNIKQAQTNAISTSAMLVELSISTWTGRKLDKTASTEVTTNKGAIKGAANVNKKLMADCAELDAVQKFAGNSRTAHYESTMPWSDMGMRLLPTTKYFDYHQKMTAVRAEFYKLVDDFINVYDWEIAQAQVKLGELFNPMEYPDKETIRAKFKFNMFYMPVPDAGDWRLDINNETLHEVTSQYESYYATQLNNAMRDLWTRLHGVLTRMSERMDYSDSGTKKIFRDSLVENVMEVVDMMKSCNITGDTQMTAAAEKLEGVLLGVTPDALREDGYLRYETKQQVDEIIKGLPSLDF